MLQTTGVVGPEIKKKIGGDDRDVYDRVGENNKRTVSRNVPR